MGGRGSQIVQILKSILYTNFTQLLSDVIQALLKFTQLLSTVVRYYKCSNVFSIGAWYSKCTRPTIEAKETYYQVKETCYEVKETCYRSKRDLLSMHEGTEF